MTLEPGFGILCAFRRKQTDTANRRPLLWFMPLVLYIVPYGTRLEYDLADNDTLVAIDVVEHVDLWL